MNGLVRPWLVAVLLVVVWGVPALGQHPGVERLLPGVEFERLTAIEAYQEAKRRTRLLLVYYYTPGSPSAELWERKLWRNPTLGLYIKWHAVAVKVAWPGHNGVIIVKGEDVYVAMGALPRPLVLKPGEPEPRLRRAFADTQSMPRLAGAASLLFRLDVTMDRIRALDPAWYMLHEERNPAPEPPPMPPPFHLSDDGLADIIEDPPEGSVDLWERLDAARRAAEMGNLHHAAGLYTWLWEMGDEMDPSFAPARRAFIAGEIAELGARRPPVRERFAAIRDARARRLPWAVYDDYHEWCVLNAIAGEEDLILEWFDYFINEEQEAAMIPGADKAAYDVLLSRERFADPWELGGNPVARVSRLSGLRRAARPVRIPHDDWGRLQEFLTRHLLHEACRLHAASLRAGRADDAEQIAEILLREQDTPEARHSLIIAALVAGVPQVLHLRLLDEADGRGAARADLRGRLNEALRTEVEAEPPSAAPSTASSPGEPAPSRGSWPR